MSDFIGFVEIDNDTGARKGALQLLGQLVGLTEEGEGIYRNLNVSYLGPKTLPLLPAAPTLSGTMPARNQSQVQWTATPDVPGTPAVTAWQVERRSSTNNGVSFGAWGATSGSPYGSNILSLLESNLDTGTPEIQWQYRVRGVNAAGVGEWSNIVALQWVSTPLQQPTAPTSFARGIVGSTSVGLSWLATEDTTVTKFGIFRGSTLVVDNIPASARSYDWLNLTAGSTQTNINVRRWNAAGWSPASNTLTFTLLAEEPPEFDMMIGCSASDNDHGGTEQWPLWRMYRRDKLYSIANRSGLTRPQRVYYSQDGGEPLGGNNPDYATVYNHVREELDRFYYTGVGSDTRSARWGIEKVWLNGNEMSDQGVLSLPHNSTKINLFVNQSQKALYDAVHYAVNGVRRYPDAKAGVNPTQEHDRKGHVLGWLLPAAQYIDIIVWSLYPPGRGVNDIDLSRNPRLDWPSFNPADRMNRQTGFLLRGFMSTKEAEARARIDKGDPTFRMEMGVGEIGIASDPDDRSQRPYYAAHLMGSIYLLARQFALRCTGVCWWDNATIEQGYTIVTTRKPHNILSDEPPNSDHLHMAIGGTAPAAGNNTIATNPSTMTAIRNWQNYDKRFPGSSQPAQWAGNPKSSWNQPYGTPI